MPFNAIIIRPNATVIQLHGYETPSAVAREVVKLVRRPDPGFGPDAPVYIGHTTGLLNQFTVAQLLHLFSGERIKSDT